MANKTALIVALDYSDLASAMSMVDLLGDSVDYYKVGMELYLQEGLAAVTALKERGKRVFLDLKLHDIPHTVAATCRALAAAGADLLTVHAAGGTAMLRAARDAVTAAESTRTHLVAVTVLTSIDAAESRRQGWRRSVPEQVLLLAETAQHAGLDGVVASPREASHIRQRCGEKFFIVTPGIRPRGAAVQDQVRVATPAQAVAAGATHLVVGRPITTAPDPVAAARTILQDMDAEG